MIPPQLTPEQSKEAKEWREQKIKENPNSLIAKSCSIMEEETERIKEQQEINNLKLLVLMNLRKDKNKSTELIVRYIEEHNKIFTTRSDKQVDVYIHDGKIIKPEGITFIKEFCRMVLGEAYTTQLANEIIIKIEADTYVDEEWLFNQESKYEIAVQNGILNVITRELKPFSKDKIFFNLLPVVYNPEAKCPLINKFLTDVLKYPSDAIVFKEIVGRGLYKDNFLEKAALFEGKGRNGKSKAISLIKSLVGESNCCSIPLASMINESFFIAPLHKKMFNLAGDLSNTALKETGCFKEIVGRDTIQAHRKFKNDITFINHSQQVFACNELPIVYDKSDGFWTKWALLKFPYQFISQDEMDKLLIEERTNKKLIDTEIIKKITTPEELSGFLNECLDGLKRIRTNHDFTKTPGSKELKDYWIRNSDAFAGFCMDYVELDNESFVTKKELRNLLTKYCRYHKLRGSSDRVIKTRLENDFGAIEDRKIINEKQEYGWVGIRFKPIAIISPIFEANDKILNYDIGIKREANVATKCSNCQNELVDFEIEQNETYCYACKSKGFK